MATHELTEKIDSYKDILTSKGYNQQVFEYLVQATQVARFEKDKSLELSTASWGKKYIENYIRKETGGDVWSLDAYCKENNVIFQPLNHYFSMLLIEARNQKLDSYLLYLEKNRRQKERFYLPKRACFIEHGIIPALQDMLDDKLDILTISMPPSTQKTTCSKFFVSGLMGWRPDKYSLFFSHSDDITRMYYDGVLDIISDDVEYTWNAIFPNSRVTKTDAKREQITIDKYKPYPNLQCTSIGAKNAGKVRCNYYLLVDDLIARQEEALNKAYLDKLWNSVYAVDARQRKMGTCKEIHIATRWSVHDVIGRLKVKYAGNSRVRFISVPDINPKTGESNFDYEYNGFTKEFFHEQEMIMDPISYRCLYRNEPIEREGLLYNLDELRRYETLPEGEPDAILGVCDTKTKGIDYMVLIVAYKYGDDYYIADCVCDDTADFDVQQRRLADAILDNNMQQCEFESNAGGDRLAHEVAEIVEANGGRCNITTKTTLTNKETRILVNSDWVKKNCIFKSAANFTPRSNYGLMMDQLGSYSIAGKNVHDDVCDAFSNLCLYATRNLSHKRAKIIRSPIGSYH